MFLDSLATELLLQIFRSCSSIADVLNLSLTCHRLHAIYAGSQKLVILAHAADVEYGPLEDIIQLVTQNASQPAHVIREAPMSISLLKQIVGVGRVARTWEEIYPLKKWKVDYENRRLLSVHERYVLRRAIYRLWLYSRSFHSRNYPRTSRLVASVVHERAELLHNWSTAELAEIEDARLVIRDVVQNHICPSNGTIQRKFRKRFPDTNTQPLSFNIHLNYPPSPSPSPENGFFHNYALGLASELNGPGSNKYAGQKFRPDLYYDIGAEGWGDELPHYYIVEDMLKLDPGQVLWLREHAPLKEQVERFVRSMGEWFENNGETFGQTLEWVMGQRGEDVYELRDAIIEGDMGVSKGV